MSNYDSNISINDILKNAKERAKKLSGSNSSSTEKGYSNWGDFPKDSSKPFDMKKTTDVLSKKLNDFSSTASVRIAQTVSQLNDRVNGKTKDDVESDSSSLDEPDYNLNIEDYKEKPKSDLGTEYPHLLDDWKSEEARESRSTGSSFLSSGTIEDIADRLRKTSQKARESETYGRISRTLSDYRMSISEALDDGDHEAAETIDHTDGYNVLVNMVQTHSPVVVSGEQKERVVQELSDSARKKNMTVEQIPMVLKDEVSLRRLVSDIRSVKNTNRVVVLDIADSPNAEQLRIFVKFLEDAKAGNFYLVVLSSDEFSNSWFKINGVTQLNFDS